MAIELLPAEHEAPACASFTREIGASPAGSGLELDRIVVVSVPGPWPKPALAHPLLKPIVASITASSVATRLFAGEPSAAASTVEIYERSGLTASLTRFDSDDRQEILQVCEQVAVTAIGQLAAIDGATHDVLQTPTLLVCTQGSHDNCCGLHGEQFAAQAEAQGVLVRRVSHTGGHRFAPTAMSLPDGRMWAWLDGELLGRVITGELTSDDLRTRCRGWWGARKGEPQVAEIAARIENGRTFSAAPRVTAVADQPGRYEVVVGDDLWAVHVEQARAIPTIACESPGGQPSKLSVEFGWTVTNP